MTVYAFKDQETGAPVYIVRKGLNPEGCEQVIEGLKDRTDTASHMVGHKIETSTDGTRNSSVHFFMDPDLKQTLDRWIQAANYETGWRYDVTGSEMLQFTKYDSKDKQHYDWHVDGNQCHFSTRHFTYKTPSNLRETTQAELLGTVRKISVSAILNEDYEGGEFETKHIVEGKEVVSTIKTRTGDVIIFPAFLSHRVKPVTKGIRYSVVAWYGGPPLK